MPFHRMPPRQEINEFMAIIESFRDQVVVA